MLESQEREAEIPAWHCGSLSAMKTHSNGGDPGDPVVEAMYQRTKELADISKTLVARLRALRVAAQEAVDGLDKTDSPSVRRIRLKLLAAILKSSRE